MTWVITRSLYLQECLMLFQLSDVEYTILDTLADGPLTFSLLLRELRRRKQPWDPTAVLAAFNRLFEIRLIRSTLVPGAPTSVLLTTKRSKPTPRISLIKINCRTGSN